MKNVKTQNTVSPADQEPQSFEDALAALRPPRKREFVRHYLETLNGAKAARLAGYSLKTATSIASENLRKPDVKRVVAMGLEHQVMSRGETLTRLQLMARSSIEDFLEFKPGMAPKLNLEAAEAAGKLGVVRKYKVHKDGAVEIEMYSALDALEQIGRFHKLFSDRVSLENPDGSPIKFIKGVDPDDV